jgi:hypothetical protein
VVACWTVALADLCVCVSRARLCLASALRLSAPILFSVSLVPLCNYHIFHTVATRAAGRTPMCGCSRDNSNLEGRAFEPWLEDSRGTR